jgi:formylglycine-generating enzyme required for sulfatase activity
MKIGKAIITSGTRAFILMIIAAFALSSCELFFSKSSSTTGSITFETSSDAFTGIARTLRPASTLLAISTYNYHLVGPGSVVLDDTDTAGTKSFTNIVVGSWTATVTALNSSSVTLLSGTKIFTVSAGQNANVSIALTAAAGNGTVSFALTLPTFVTTVGGTVQSEASGSAATNISAKIAKSGNVATYTDTLAAGTYRIILILKNSQNSTVGMIIENLDIFAGILTAPSFTLRDTDLNQVPVAPTTPIAVADDSQVTLSLTSIPGATGYNVYYKANSATATISDTKASDSPYTSLNPVIMGLMNGLQYAFIVTAINCAGEGAASTAATATPVAAIPGEVPRNGLVAEYLFNGDASDTAGTNNGTVTGATLATDRFNSSAKAYSFDGIGNYIKIPSLDSVTMSSFAYSAWIKAAQITATGHAVVNTRNGLLILYAPPNNTEAVSYDSLNGTGSVHTLVASSTMPDQWHHLVFVSQNGTPHLYINGQEYASGSVITQSVTGVYSNALIGAIQDTRFAALYGDYFNGIIDDVRIYNRALTAAEVTALYNEAGWNGSQPLLTMLPVPGGSFNNGTTTVTLSSFLMSKYEVTFNQYDAFCTATSRAQVDDSGWGRGTRPVINVSWYDAVAFCNWLSSEEGLQAAYTGSGTSWSLDRTKNGYRLPTEAEWEYAARGGASTHGYTYSGSNDVNSVAWYGSNSGNKTQTVGGKAANELGLYDMSGNVWEWNHDWYGSYPGTPESDPVGSSSGSLRVVRGGCLGNDATLCTVAYRYDIVPTGAMVGIGFRVARPDPNSATVPSGLTATPGTSQVSLSWPASTNVTSYNVYYKSGSTTATTADTKASSSMVSGTTATITGLTGGTQYGFVVTALNGTVESPASFAATATPAMPTGSSTFTITGGLLGDYAVTFTLSATPAIEAPDTSGAYPVYSIPMASLPLTILATSTPTATSFRWLLNGVEQGSTSSSLTLNSIPLRTHYLTLLLKGGSDPIRSATIILKAIN